MIVPIIFSGYNPRAVLAFVRALSQLGDIKYHIIASSDKDEIFNTIYVNHVSYVRKIKQLDLDEILRCLDNNILMVGETGLIIPSTEALNRFLITNRELFEERGCIIPLVEKNKYELLSDKDKFWNLCLERGLKVPKKYREVDEIKPPFVIKPDIYLINGIDYKPILVTNHNEYSRYKDYLSMEGMGAFEYIEDNSYYLMAYFSIYGDIKVLWQKNLAQQEGGGSIIAAILCDCPDKSVECAYLEMLRDIDFSGFIMIEFRKMNDTLYMIEANPRMWGPSQLLVDSNSGLFEMFLSDYGIDIEFNKELDMAARYFWRDGIKDISSIRFLNDGKEKLDLEKDLFDKYDIYGRPDIIGGR